MKFRKSYAGFFLIILCFLPSFLYANSKPNPVIVFSTARGSFQAELFHENQPELVDFFLNYVQAGFYDHLIFHRIIDGFIIQSGVFNADFQNKQLSLNQTKSFSATQLKNNVGTLSLILEKDQSLKTTPQFFINLANNNQLNQNQKEYVVIGKVISGMDVVEKIAHIKVGQKEGHYNVPFYPKEAMIDSIKTQIK